MRCHDEAVANCATATKNPRWYSREPHKIRLRRHLWRTPHFHDSHSCARNPSVRGVRRYCIRPCISSFPLRWFRVSGALLLPSVHSQASESQHILSVVSFRRLGAFPSPRCPGLVLLSTGFVDLFGLWPRRLPDCLCDLQRHRPRRIRLLPTTLPRAFF